MLGRLVLVLGEPHLTNVELVNWLKENVSGRTVVYLRPFFPGEERTRSPVLSRYLWDLVGDKKFPSLALPTRLIRERVLSILEQMPRVEIFVIFGAHRFLSENLLPTIRELISYGKTVVVSARKLDRFGIPFPTTLQLLPEADIIDDVPLTGVSCKQIIDLKTRASCGYLATTNIRVQLRDSKTPKWAQQFTPQGIWWGIRPTCLSHLPSLSQIPTRELGGSLEAYVGPSRSGKTHEVIAIASIARQFLGQRVVFFSVGKHGGIARRPGTEKIEVKYPSIIQIENSSQLRFPHYPFRRHLIVVDEVQDLPEPEKTLSEIVRLVKLGNRVIVAGRATHPAQEPEMTMILLMMYGRVHHLLAYCTIPGCGNWASYTVVELDGLIVSDRNQIEENRRKEGVHMEWQPRCRNHLYTNSREVPEGT